MVNWQKLGRIAGSAFRTSRAVLGRAEQVGKGTLETLSGVAQEVRGTMGETGGSRQSGPDLDTVAKIVADLHHLGAGADVRQYGRTYQLGSFMGFDNRKIEGGRLYLEGVLVDPKTGVVISYSNVPQERQA